jgi:hypothetical protein
MEIKWLIVPLAFGLGMFIVSKLIDEWRRQGFMAFPRDSSEAEELYRKVLGVTAVDTLDQIEAKASRLLRELDEIPVEALGPEIVEMSADRRRKIQTALNFFRDQRA